MFSYFVFVIKYKVEATAINRYLLVLLTCTEWLFMLPNRGKPLKLAICLVKCGL